MAQNAAVQAIARTQSKEDMARRIFKDAKARQKMADEAKRVGSNVAVAAGSSAVAFGTGWLFQKYPNAAKIPGTEIDTDLALGGVATLAGVAMAGKAGQDGQLGLASMVVGLGMLLPYLHRKGGEANI